MIKKRYSEEFVTSENVLVLAERINRKASPGKFYKHSFQNIYYFNKERTFIIRKIRPIDGIKFYWLEDAQNNRKLTKRFQRTELFTIRGNFVT